MESISVSECLEQLNNILQTQVVIVEGEVQDFRVSQGRWGFFSLKDEHGIIECFIMAFRVRVPLEDGMTIRVTATPGIHQRSGRFRLTVEHIEIVGAGALKRAFELMRRKLESEGLFSEARKRRLPRFPEAIGLIASVDSAAYSDFLKVMNARWSGVTVYVAPVSVQGERAAREVAEALHMFADFPEPLDAVVITRGGGSLEDLMAFNDEALARAIFKSPVPVISAVGHERDVTIADYVADVRASTPSNAAELLVPDRREVQRELLAYASRLVSALGRSFMSATHDLDRMTHYYVAAFERQRHDARAAITRFMNIASAMNTQRQILGDELSTLEHRIEVTMTTNIRHARESFVNATKRLNALHPERLLTRGYSIVRLRGRVVKSRRDLAPHEAVDITLADGQVAAEIISTHP